MNTDVHAIAERFGTPVYIHRAEAVEEAASDLFRALPTPCELYFSLKANPNRQIGAILRDAGCQAEISSVGELHSAREAGFDLGRALYTGPGKTVEEIDEALGGGVLHYSCESVRDLHRVAATAHARGVTAECLLRVNAPSAPGHGAMRMTGAASQFGIDIDSVEIDPADLVVAGARVIGFHFYPMSNATDVEDLAGEMENSIRHAALLAQRWEIDLSVVDLGGGFAAPYGDEGTRPRYEGLCDRVEAALDETLPGWREGDPRIVFESGRYLTCDSAVLVARVMDVKRSRDRDFVVTDTGIHHVGGLSGIGRVLPMRAATLAEAGVGGSEATGAVVGPLCTPADILNRQASLEDVAPDRLITIPNVGAYGVTASLMGFLSRPTPAEVVTRGGEVVAASRISITREDITHMTEHMPPTASAEDALDPTADGWDEDFERLLREVLTRVDDRDEFDRTATLRSLGVDSLALVHLLTTVETHFGVTVPDQALFDGRCDTPSGLWDVVSEGRSAD